MRTLLLSVLLLASGPIAMAVDDNGNGAFTDLARKNAINSVCPLDGKPINAQLTPIALLDQNGQQVYIGADSQACLDDMRPKTGPDAYAVIAAARANTTLKAQSHVPAAGGASSIANAPQVGSQPSEVYTPPTTNTLSAPTPTFGTQPTSTFGTPPSDAQPATVLAAPAHHTSRHHHETSSSGHYDEDTDERQRQKKASQRRDGDSWEGGETGTEPEHHSTHHTHHHTSHPASTPSTTPSTTSPTSSAYPPASTSGSSSAFGTSSSFGGGGSSSFAPAAPAPSSSSNFSSPPSNFAPASPAFTSGSGATPAAGGAPSDPTPAPTH